MARSPLRMRTPRRRVVRFYMPSSADLICVDPGWVQEIWPLVAPMLRRATARTGLSAFQDVESEVLCGRALLWLAVRREANGLEILAAASTRLQETDASKVCVITACAGSDMPRWLGLLDGIESFARKEGCASVRIYGRKGWLRALDGYEQRHVVIEKELSQ